MEQRQIITLEALVMWTESLRDTVTARASLEQAIPATAVHASPAIRPALIRLVGQLRARVPLDVALLALSAELNDASADKVIGALILNTRHSQHSTSRTLSFILDPLELIIHSGMIHKDRDRVAIRRAQK